MGYICRSFMATREIYSALRFLLLLPSFMLFRKSLKPVLYLVSDRHNRKTSGLPGYICETLGTLACFQVVPEGNWQLVHQ